MSFSLSESLNAGIACLQQNDLEKAAKLFQGVLHLQADNPDALHLLGVVKQEQGDPLAAVQLLERAVNKKADISYSANLCNSLIALKDYSKAESYCLPIVASNPDYDPAFYHMARICFFTDRLEEALQYCLQATKINQLNFAAHSLLAQIYSEQQCWQQAGDVYKLLLKSFPDSADIQFGLGLANQKQGDFTMAERCYKMALQLNSDLSEAYNGLGSIYFSQGQLQKSFSMFYQALKKNNENVEAHYNQGLVLRALGRLEEALEALQCAHNLNPRHRSALSSLGLTLQELGRPDEAIKRYQDVLLMEPDNSVAKHMLSALQGVNTDKAPVGFVADLFDAYASSYEQHLVSVLGFSAPTQISAALKQYCPQELPFTDGIDLGCGTGLMAEKLSSMVNHLDGVDLSAKMLDVARCKNIYRSLSEADLSSFLKNKKNCYDLCVASDVFIYLGDLAEVFHFVHASMKKNGIFIFTTEKSQNSSFELLRSGRYAHSKLVISELGKASGFKVCQQISEKIRKENESWLDGHIHILQKLS